MKNIIFLTLIILTVNIQAQIGGSYGLSSPREVGMANTFTASVRGINSVGQNPANLAVRNGYHIVEVNTLLPLPSIAFHGGSEGFSIDDFNYFFTSEVTDANGDKVGRQLTQNDKERLVELIGKGDFINTGFSLNIFGISYFPNNRFGSLALNIRDRFMQTSSIPEDLMKLLLNGNPLGSEYSFNDVNLEAHYLREFSLSYGKQVYTSRLNIIKDLFVGASAKILVGYGYASIEKSDILFKTLENGNYDLNSDVLARLAVSADYGIEYDFDDTPKEKNIGAFPEAAGTGFGFDIGATAELYNGMIVGISITDIGTMNWNGETVQYVMKGSRVIDDFTDNDNIDSLETIFDLEGSYSPEFSSDLPTALHIGIQSDLNKILSINSYKKFIATLDIHQGFNDVPGNSTTPKVSMGIEYQALNWIFLRTGFSVGGKYGFQWSAGLGFDTGPLEFNFASSEMASSFMGNNAKNLSFAMGALWKF